ncbi:hypothetical protein [Clostridium butyricum]|uniref:hypothetical protein n=1 Tax=Clostridium butyricum TaxID=1492 RepID=UPI00374FA4FE
MLDIKKDIIYNKFNNNTIELSIDSRTINTIILAAGVFKNYLKEELVNGNSLSLRNDIKRVERVLRELVMIKNNNDIEGNLNINITIAEFLIFKYVLNSVIGLVVSLELEDSRTIGYYDFLMHLDEKYNLLDNKEIEMYYEFLS